MQPNLMKVRRLALVVSASGGAALLLIAGFIAYCAYTLPLSRGPAVDTPAATAYASAAGAPFAIRGVYRGEPVTADRLPANLAKAVVAVEDRRFYSHHGVDLRGVLRSAWHNLWRQSVEGGSTITQQLARLNYLSNERSLRRKVQEVMLALWLESRLSKQEILTRYLNGVYFGAGAIGADAAAKRYFGKKATDLDIAEAAVLAGLIRAPSHLAPSRNPKAARRRGEVVLEAMVRAGAIDERTAAAARAKPVQLAVAPETSPNDNYFLDTAEAEVKRLIGSPPLDLSVTTTFDPNLQDAAERTVKHWLTEEGARRHIGQVAVVAMAPDGAVLAMVGGRDYTESQFNRVTQARRQPGSLFKIVVYLAAFNSGYKPDSLMVDKPVQIDDWQPRNYDGQFRGPVTLKTAFAQSINSVAAQLAQAVGIDKVIAMAKSLGIQSELRAEPGLALGSAEVTLLEMTRAMDAIATDTRSTEPYTVRVIRAPSATLYTRPDTPAERPDWHAARAPMMHLLEAVVTDGTGKAARLDRRAAGKTGTTDDYRDAWFVGFTTDIVVGVWVGNDDNKPMDQVTGGDLPARIWHDFVVEATRIMKQPPASGPAAVTGSSTKPAASPALAKTPDAAVPATPAPAVPTAAPAVAAAPPSPVSAAPAPPPSLRGVPQVVDSATLRLNTAVIRLSGVEGTTGKPAEELGRYIRGREVSCQPVGDGAGQYRCTVGDYDLGEAVLLNGAGRAAGNAPARLRQAEQQARVAGRGIWAR
jgi:penicillin-binding protein 1A